MNLLDEAKEQFKNFQKDIQSTAKIIIKSSTKWGKISSVPSVDVDVILTFPTDSDMNFIQWFMVQLVENVPELSFSLNYHRNADEYALYITSSYKSLLRGAELLNIRKKVVPEFGGGYRELNLDELDMFQDVSEEELFLTSQERQSIIMYWLTTLKATTKTTEFGVTFYPLQSIVPILKNKGKISQIFPLHNRDQLRNLENTWVTKFTNPQPLDEIAGYFGVKIALYFAWLGHYTTALIIPTAIGVIGWQMTSQGNMDLYYLLTALFNILWATYYLKHWRRTCSELTYKWGTIDYQIVQNFDERPEFKGEMRACPLTGQQTRYYANWKRQMVVYFVSLPIIFVCVLCIIKVSLIFSSFQVWVDHNIEEKHWFGILSPIPKVMLAFVIGFMDDIFKKIAVKLNKLENHRHDETYKNYLMTKLILFQFMNSFFSLFYIAFYLNDLVKLREQLATLLITRQFIGNIKEIVMPFVNTRLRQTLMGIKYEKRRRIQQQQQQQKQPATRADSEGDEASSMDTTAAVIGGAETGISAARPDTLDVGATESEQTSPPGCRNRAKKTQSHGETATSDDDTASVEAIPTTATTPGGSHNLAALANKNCTLTPGEQTLFQAEEEATLPKYDDPFEDFLEMFIQFGYVSMFACAFPLAGLFCLLNNILEIRSDAFKLISSFQRPFGANVSSIGVWQRALEALSYVAVAVNMGLLGVSGGLGRLLEAKNPVFIVVAIVLIEHIIILVKFLIDQAAPDVPFWIEQERNIIEHKRRDALKMLEKEAMKQQRKIRASSCEPVDPREPSLPPVEQQSEGPTTRSRSRNSVSRQQ